MMTIRFGLIAATLAALMGVGSVFAQTRYTCKSPTGSLVISDMPCAPGLSVSESSTVSPDPKLAGPATRRYSTADYAQFMSPRCGSMLEGIRTGPARRVNPRTTAELQIAYQRECRDEELEALRRVSDQRTDSQFRIDEARRAQNANASRQALIQQQCEESKRIIYTKRKRTDMTEGEKADLVRFEDTYRAKCD